MKLYLIKYTWRGERYINDDLGRTLAFSTIEDAKEHIGWELGDFPEDKAEQWESKFEIVEIDVPFVRGIDR